MAQSLSVVNIHVVFSTKHRRPYLRDIPVRQLLHAYLGEISKRLSCPPIRVGGVEDHVHLLARLSRTTTQVEWVKELKRASNLWLQEQSDQYTDFQWQGGYATFSVSRSGLDQVTHYVANQAEHHRRMSYQDELRTLLGKHQAQWDERYLWD